MRNSNSRLTLAHKWLLAIALVSLLAAFFVAGVGFDLPGPRLRDELGLANPKPRKLGPCKPDPSEDRTPAAPNPGPGSWRTEPALDYPRDEIRATTYKGRVYLANGHDLKVRSIDKFEMFNPRTGRYAQLPGTPKPVDHSSLVTYKDDLYLVGGNTNLKGGYARANPNANLWRYSPSTRKWTELASMHLPRWGHTAGVIGDKLYVVSGIAIDEDELVRAMEVYDFKEDRWTFGPELPTGRHHTGSAVVDGKLYVVGGRNPRTLHDDAVERYDPETDKWEKLSPIPVGTGGPGVVEHDGKLIVIAGGDDQEGWVTRAVWSYDPSKEKWSRLPNISLARHGHAAAVANNRIYIFGGAPCAGFGRTAIVESLPAPN